MVATQKTDQLVQMLLQYDKEMDGLPKIIKQAIINSAIKEIKARPTKTPTPTPRPTAPLTAAYRCGSHSPAANYEQLARFPERNEGKCFAFKGEVVQVTGIGFRINITEGRYSWSDDIFVFGFNFRPEFVSCLGSNGRVLEDDIVEFYGTAEGTRSYETIFGAVREVPLVFCISDKLSRHALQNIWEDTQSLLENQ